MLLVFIIKLVNDPEVMGAHTNGRLHNVLARMTVVAVATL
jgi:Mn2+/Fe2+ NRAMP family transporter